MIWFHDLFHYFVSCFGFMIWVHELGSELGSCVGSGVFHLCFICVSFVFLMCILRTRVCLFHSGMES